MSIISYYNILYLLCTGRYVCVCIYIYMAIDNYGELSYVIIKEVFIVTWNLSFNPSPSMSSYILLSGL